MEPILTAEQMSVVDAASGPVETLIERAGWEIAFRASQLMGGCYGRRVVVIAGKGNNGADGRVAAGRLRERGALVDVVPPGDSPIEGADLVVDAAFGTGLRGRWAAPFTTARVLAVDLPSGLDPLTGEDRGGFDAELTVTFGAHKPGLFFDAGPRRAGRVVVAPIGLRLDAVDIDTWRWTDAACVANLTERSPTDHKWSNAVRVIGGSPGMEGAPALVAAAALRAGAGMVVASRPDGGHIEGLPVSAVQRQLGGDWVAGVLMDIGRFTSVVIGPGLGHDHDNLWADVRELIERCPIPAVVDADAIRAIGVDHRCLSVRSTATVVTPHDGEYAALTGSQVGPDRLAAARSCAAGDVVMLLKGPATVVADGSGRCGVVTNGDQRLATAGSGDVLAGMLAATDLRDHTWARVASVSHWHGAAGLACEATGATADEIVEMIGVTRSRLESGAAPTR